MTDIIVEDGSIVENANSYITISGTNTYATDYGYTDWTDSTITDDVKTQCILKAMRYIEGLSWKGTKYTQEQELEFPRENLCDKNGYTIDTTDIPKQVISATYETAILNLPDSDVDLQPTLTKDDYSVSVEIKDATYEKFSDRGIARRNRSIIIEDLLRGLIKSTFIVSLERG